MANKQPYIPIYIGDWERDTNSLTPLCEFALLKLTFKLFSAPQKGIFVANFRTLSVLFKSNMDETKAIFDELIDNNVLNIEPIEDGKFRIISRRMTREAIISEIRSVAGEQGGRGKKANKKQTKSKIKAKALQNTDNDIEYIVKLLNECSGKKFDHKTAETVRLITARKKDGYLVSDFEKVIKFKCEQWINDEKFSEFLRPQTLFSNKFESYLNSVPKTKQSDPNAISQADYAKP